MSTLQTPAQSPATTPATAAKPRYKGKSGGQIFHEMLVQQHKVEVMFGYPGGAILPVFDQLYKTPAKFILNRHEQGSGHAADGYARATGKPGVCIVTSGPGATQYRHPPRNGPDGFGPDPRLQRPGRDQGDRQRCLSGSRRHRHHPPCTKWNTW